jgi:hypothetical protein
VFIKDANTGTGETEVHVARKGSGYPTRLFEGGSAFAERRMGFGACLILIRMGCWILGIFKDQNTRSGTVEVVKASYGWSETFL